MKEKRSGKGSILIVDDEEGIRFSMSNIFREEGYDVRASMDRASALKEISESEPDIVLLDVRLKGEDGLDVLRDIKSGSPDIIVIMITGHGSIGGSVTAMKEGAADYILKPVDRTAILKTIRKNLELKTLRTENLFLKTELRETRGVSEIVTLDTGVKAVIHVADRVKDTGASILITGESGSGKEVLARYIHYSSNRQEANFIGVNCAALSDSLLLSELFGHEKGSFTGAFEQRPGKFELAHGGTLFLDEIGDMSLEIQAKILRVLEERSFERVGGIRSIHADVRVIAATNRNLVELIGEGRFRQDLYYRLNVITCHLPPLRKRRADIPLLVRCFITRYNERYGKNIRGISPELMARLQVHDWPGNVRELQNLINQAVLLCEGDVITGLRDTAEGRNRDGNISKGLWDPRSDEPASGKGMPRQSMEFPAPSWANRSADEMVGLKGATDQYLSEFEKVYLNQALENFHGNRTRTAEALGISRKTLARKMEKYGI